MKRLKILLSNYTCVPGAGGEDAVGWRWVVYLSKHHDVTVITYSRGNFARIEQSRPETSAKFVYLTLPAWVERLKLYSRGPVAVWIHYTIWQLLAGRIAQKLHQEKPFDVVHHVVYNQFRTPSFGYKLGIPFVFGPVGGAETVPLPLFRDLQWRNWLKESIRVAEIWLRKRLRVPPNPKTAYIFANPSTQQVVIGSHPHPHNYLMPAVFVDESDMAAIDFTDDDGIERSVPDEALLLVMPGRMLDWKGPVLALRALAQARAKGCDIRLRIVGEIVLEQKIKALCQELQLEEAIEITTYMRRVKLLKLFSKADALLYAAFRDSGAMVVAESYLLSKPAIILDIDSQFHIEPRFGIKAGVGKTYEETVDNLADALQWAFEHKSELPQLGAIGKAHLLETLSWDSKVKTVEAIYERLLLDAGEATAPGTTEPSAARAETAASVNE